MEVASQNNALLIIDCFRNTALLRVEETGEDVERAQRDR
jgi:hypothetical protein